MRCMCETGKPVPIHGREYTNLSECFMMTAADGAALMLRQGLKVDTTDYCHLLIRNSEGYAYIDINYCPICGRRLDGQI